MDLSATHSVLARLALVVCTRNRAQQLRKCLDNLDGLPLIPAWQLVIVDNGSTDDTAHVIEAFRRQSRHRVTSVFEATAGLGRARNRGWLSAEAPVVAFTDDDCYPDHDFIAAVLAVFDAHPSLGFLGGRIVLYDPTDYPITIQENPDRIDLPPGRFIPAGLIQGANFSMRRVALLSIGGFDNRFGAGALFPCEDVDAVARASANGWAGAYDPTPLVYHHHGRKTSLEAARLMREYDRGRGAYYMKCLLNPRLRALALRYWARQVIHQSAGTTARELRASVEYIGRSWLARGT
jgi:GT2 family glycosyltransferase